MKKQEKNLVKGVVKRQKKRNKSGKKEKSVLPFFFFLEGLEKARD